jgi:hypothetical protein
MAKKRKAAKKAGKKVTKKKLCAPGRAPGS